MQLNGRGVAMVKVKAIHIYFSSIQKAYMIQMICTQKITQPVYFQFHTNMPQIAKPNFCTVKSQPPNWWPSFWPTCQLWPPKLNELKWLPYQILAHNQMTAKWSKPNFGLATLYKSFHKPNTQKLLQLVYFSTSQILAWLPCIYFP